MPDLFSRAMVKGDPYADAEKAIAWMRKDFPYLHDLLAGSKGSNGSVDRLPGSVRLFTNGGELKCEITGQEWLMRGYLVLPQGVLSIPAIEEQLSQGKIGWSAKTERTNSLPKLPY